MANYPNTMRNSHMENLYSQQRQNYGNTNRSRGSRSCTQNIRREGHNCNCVDTRTFKRQSEENNCSCSEEQNHHSCAEECMENLCEMPLAMAYVPWQNWRNIYEICKGFQRGTIFAELDKPFLGRGGCNR